MAPQKNKQHIKMDQYLLDNVIVYISEAMVKVQG